LLIVYQGFDYKAIFMELLQSKFEKTQHFKCYLTMPIAVKADPHWFMVNQIPVVWQCS